MATKHTNKRISLSADMAESSHFKMTMLMIIQKTKQREKKRKEQESERERKKTLKQRDTTQSNIEIRIKKTQLL